MKKVAIITIVFFIITSGVDADDGAGRSVQRASVTTKKTTQTITTMQQPIVVEQKVTPTQTPVPEFTPVTPEIAAYRKYRHKYSRRCENLQQVRCGCEFHSIHDHNHVPPEQYNRCSGQHGAGNTGSESHFRLAHSGRTSYAGPL